MPALFLVFACRSHSFAFGVMLSIRMVEKAVLNLLVLYTISEN